MHGSFQKKREVVPTWRTATCKSHPHQMWLGAAHTNKAVNFAAYRAACADLSDDVCEEVFGMHDSAQHHFISMLLWDKPGVGYMSVEEAVRLAWEHHEDVSKNA